MPRRSGRATILLVITSSLLEAQHLAIGRPVGARLHEIVEGAIGNADDVIADELGSFSSSVFRILEKALPLEHRPSVEVVGRKLREDRENVDLAVAERAESSCSVLPRLKATICPGLAIQAEFGVLDVEHLDPLVVVVDEREVIDSLQHEMARVVEDVAATMVADPSQEQLEGQTIVHVFAWVDFETQVDALFIELVQDRAPARGEL